MKKKYIFVFLLLMIFIPLPFIWFGYGEKGIYGYWMLQSPYFWGGWSMILLSKVFHKTWLRGFRGVGGATVFWYYPHTAIDFCRHLPFDYSPFEACKLPMWISLLGSIGLFFAYWYYYECEKESEL